MNAEQDYVLGTHDAEIARLGVQHRAWRASTLDAWTRAGMTTGSRVLDLGAGPGYATVDAAELVGPTGEVLGVDRSERFLQFAREQARVRGLSWVRLQQADLGEDSVAAWNFDIAWCRWVASFVHSPRRLVDTIAGALRVGGRVVFHEYANYATWRTSPRSPVFEKFVAEVMASWRASGGEPDVALELPALLHAAGIRIISVRPIVHTTKPGDFLWQWPASFVDTGLNRLVELNRVPSEWAQAARAAFRQLEQDPQTIMTTPMVMELIAERVR